MEDWTGCLAGTLDQVWRRLARGVADRRAPARHPVLATLGRNGRPEAGIVVLRAADRAAGRLDFHTDALSAKTGELAAEPRAGLHVRDARARLQIRLRVLARPVAAAEIAAAWARVPEVARSQYGGTPPGEPIGHPGEDEPGADPARFVAFVCRVEEMETLVLGAERHARARFRRREVWASVWLAP